MEHLWKNILFFTFILSLRINSARGIQKPTNNELLSYLKHFNTNRHHFKNPEGKRQARDFIRDTFRSFGLHTWTESFNPSDPEIKNKVTGVNIVALLPGRLSKTRDDRLILIGSHYDTTRTTSHGADDNGSGVVAMLQIARQLTSGNCQREYSVMFVAFDFEEWENNTLPYCACARLGCGSRAFVANFSQYYNRFPNMSVARYGELQGAIIMDTMMNYNSTPKSQVVPPGLKKIFPGQFKAIAANGFRGDFILVTGRYLIEYPLLKTFRYYYKLQGGTSSKYKIQVFPLSFYERPKDLHLQTSNLFSHFLRSDHVSFWNDITSDRAIFLSDTANMRSYMRTCYHKDCDDLSHVTDDFLRFLAKSCGAVVRTTNDLTETSCATSSAEARGSDLSAGDVAVMGIFAVLIPAANGIAVYVFCRRRKKNQQDNTLVLNDQLSEDPPAETPQRETREAQANV